MFQRIFGKGKSKTKKEAPEAAPPESAPPIDADSVPPADETPPSTDDDVPTSIFVTSPDSKAEEPTTEPAAAPPADEATPAAADTNAAPEENKETTESQEQPKPKEQASQEKPRPADSASCVNSACNMPTARNSTNYTATDVEEAYRNAPASKWKYSECRFNGRLEGKKIGRLEDVRGKSLNKGIKKFKENPGTYAAIMFAPKIRSWPAKQQEYTLVHRQGTIQLKASGIDAKGNMMVMIQDYFHLPQFPDDELPPEHRDPYTWNMTFRNRLLHASPTNRPILPGRGMGVCDTPAVKIIGDVDPSDVNQGLVGDCWLLSAISALAEFDGGIKWLYRKTPDLDNMPHDDGQPNWYTITLYDLTTFEEVDIVMDESLAASPMCDGNLLGSKPSEDGELWVCYLEKAFAIHCGGWDKLVGGQCAHACKSMLGSF
jgi:hypothetical protein